MGAAAPAVGAIAGGVLSMKGSKDAAKASQQGNKYTEKARQEAKGYVQPDSIYKMSEWMFPGLLPKPNFSMEGGDPKSSVRGSGKNNRKYRMMERYVNRNTDEYGTPANPSVGRFSRALASNTISQQKKDKQEQDKQMLGVINQDPELAAAIASALGVEGRATGGPVQAGTPYVVGENSPEVMVPDQPGTVVPITGGVDNVGPGPSAPGIPGPTVPGPVPEQQVNPLGEERTNSRLADLMQAFGQRREGMGEQAQPTNQEPIQGSDLGGLGVEHTRNFLENPGELSTIQYERAQEQANQGLQTNVQGMMGALTGRGIDPRSGLGGTLLQGAVRQANEQRSDAARDLSLQQEALKRQDIQTGMTAYTNFLNQVFGIIGQQAGTAGGGSFSNPQAVNPYGGLATGIASAGSLYADYQAGKQQPSTVTN